MKTGANVRFSLMLTTVTLFAAAPVAAQDKPCSKCGTGAHWIDGCGGAGSDNTSQSQAIIEISDSPGCAPPLPPPNPYTLLPCPPPDHLLVVGRSAPLDVSINFPAYGSSDNHDEVIDTELQSMCYSNMNGSVTLWAGMGTPPGTGITNPSLGTIVEDISDNTSGYSFFDIYFMLDLGGMKLYNQDPLRVESMIHCVPPIASYFHVDTCIPLYPTPGFLAGQMPVKYFATAGHIVNGGSNGDPHLHTFDGLFYDFMTTGDFVLASTGPSFIVHVRQEPTSNGCSWNTGVAMQLGSSRVVIQANPLTLRVDGAVTNLADLDSLTLPGGDVMFRAGPLLQITRTTGEKVDVTHNHVSDIDGNYLNVEIRQVILGSPVGLLGNANGNVNDDLAMPGGELLGAAPTLEQLQEFAEAWRVPKDVSLFDTPPPHEDVLGTIDIGVVDTILKEEAYCICMAAGLTDAALVEACAEDVARTNNPALVESFKGMQAPRATLQQGPDGRWEIARPPQVDPASHDCGAAPDPTIPNEDTPSPAPGCTVAPPGETGAPVWWSLVTVAAAASHLRRRSRGTS